MDSGIIITGVIGVLVGILGIILGTLICKGERVEWIAMRKDRLLIGLMSALILIVTPTMAKPTGDMLAIDGKIVEDLSLGKYTHALQLHNIDGRTMVPIRVVSENLKAEVKWDTQTSQYEIHGINVKTNEPTIIKGTSNSPQATVNGKLTKLDENDNVVAKVIDGKTYVPLRFFAEALGYEVEADTGYGGIYVVYLDSPNSPKRQTARTGQGVIYKPGIDEKEFYLTLQERIMGVSIYEGEAGLQLLFIYNHYYLNGDIGRAHGILFNTTSPYSSADKGYDYKMVLPSNLYDPKYPANAYIEDESTATMRAVREIFSAITVESDRVYSELMYCINSDEDCDGYTTTTSDGRTFKFTGESGMPIIRIK